MGKGKKDNASSHAHQCAVAQHDKALFNYILRIALSGSNFKSPTEVNDALHKAIR